MKLIPSPLAIATLLLVSGLAQAKPPAELIKLEVMTTTRGKTYKKLTVRDVTPAGIKILHEGGTATLHYEELPAYLRERLGAFDPEKAQQYLEEEEKRLKEQQSQIQRDLDKMKKEEEDRIEKPAPTTDEDEKSMPSLDEDEGLPSNSDEKEAEKPALKPTPAPSEKVTPALPEDPAKAQVNKGTLTARIIGYKTGVKRVEFRVVTNCDAKLKVHNIPPYHHSQTFDIPAQKPFVREIWVYNDYRSELLTTDGEKLDYEDRTSKSETGRLTPAKLR